MKTKLLTILIFLLSVGNSTNFKKLQIKDDGLIYKKNKLYSGQVFIDWKAPVIENNQLSFALNKKFTKRVKKMIKNANINKVINGKRVGNWFEYSPNYIFSFKSNYVDGVRKITNIDALEFDISMYKYVDLIKEIESLIPGFSDILYALYIKNEKKVTNDLNRYFCESIRNQNQRFFIEESDQKYFIEFVSKHLSLRGMVGEFDIDLWASSQANRSALDKLNFDEVIAKKFPYNTANTSYYKLYSSLFDGYFSLSNNKALGITKEFWIKDEDPFSLVLFKYVGLREKDENQINYHRYAIINRDEDYIDSVNYIIEEKLKPHFDDDFKVPILDSLEYFELLSKCSFIKPYDNQAMIISGDTMIVSNNGNIEIKKNGRKLMELVEYLKKGNDILHIKTFHNDNQNFEIKIYDKGKKGYNLGFPSKEAQTFNYKSNNTELSFAIKNNKLYNEINFKDNENSLKIKLNQDKRKSYVTSIDANHSFNDWIGNKKIEIISGNFKNKKFSGDISFLISKKGSYAGKYKNNKLNKTNFKRGNTNYVEKGSDFYVTDYSYDNTKVSEGLYSKIELNEYNINEWGEKKLAKTYSKWLQQGYHHYFTYDGGKKAVSILFNETGFPIENKAICFDDNEELTTCKSKTVFLKRNYWYQGALGNQYVTEFKNGPSASEYHQHGNIESIIKSCKSIESTLNEFNGLNQYLLDEAEYLIGKFFFNEFLKKELSHQTLKNIDFIYQTRKKINQ